jgi:hypothetical protein
MFINPIDSVVGQSSIIMNSEIAAVALKGLE